MKKNIKFLSIISLLSLGLVLPFLGNTFSSKEEIRRDSRGFIIDEITPNYNDLTPVKMQLMDYTDYSAQPSGDNLYNTQKNYHLSSLDLGDTWDYYRGDGVTIAVIDTGVNYSHEDFVYLNQSGTSLSNKSACFTSTGYSVNTTTVASNGWSVVSDENGHGTNVASTIVSRINGKGCVGVAPNVNLMFLKAAGLMSNEFDRAIRYAADNGADIISMSIGLYKESFTSPYTGKVVTYSSSADTLYNSAVNYAYNKGCVLLAAAGNDNTDAYSYPASCANVISVGALAKKSRTSKAAYSNFNKSTDTINGNHNVDVTVVGSVYVAGRASNTTYEETAGTSFSCPITAAALALYKQKNPAATNADMTDALFNSCDDIGDSGWDTTFGYGCVSISNLLDFSYDVSGIELDKTSCNPYAISGNKVDLTANILPSYATNKSVSWTSSDTTVGTVNKSTTVSGEENYVTLSGKVGTTTITATSSEGGYTATCTITTKEYVSSEFTVSPSSLDMIVGQKQQLSITWTQGTPSVSDLLFTSKDESVATVSETGLVEAIGKGTCQIEIASSDDYQLVDVEVDDDAPHSWKLITNTNQISSGDYVIFANKNAGYVSGTLNGSYLSAISATFTTDVIEKDTVSSLPDGADYYLVGGTSGTWTLTNTSNNLLYADSNSFYSSSGSGKYSTYSISINSTTYSATVKANNSYQVYYNTGSPRFKPYSSAQASFELYKKVYEDPSKTLDHISVSGMTTSFYKGDSFNFDGTCTATYVGDIIGTKNVVVTPTNITGYDMNTTGEQTVTVTYTDSFGTASTTYKINVLPVTLESLTYTGPTKTIYTEGETFSTDGLTVTAHFSNGSSKTVTDYVIDTITPLETSDTSWQISYTEGGVTVYANIGITVNEEIVGGQTLHIDFTKNNNTALDELENTWSTSGTVVKGSYLSMKNNSSISNGTNYLKVDTNHALSFKATLRTYGGANNQTLTVTCYNSSNEQISTPVVLSPSSSSLNTYETSISFTKKTDYLVKIVATAGNCTDTKYLGLGAIEINYIKYPEVTGVSLDKTNVSLDINHDVGNYSTTLTASATYDEGAIFTYSWNASVSGIVSISGSGSEITITALSKGSTVITVTAGNKQASCSITVVDTTIYPVTGVNLNTSELAMDVGDESSLVATITPTNATNKNVTWNSSDPSVCSVDSSGNLNAKKQGTATITVTTEDGGFTSSCEVSVNNVLMSQITFSKTEMTIVKDTSNTFTFTIAPNNTTYKELNWINTDSSVVSHSINGNVVTVNGLKVGTTSLTAIAVDGSGRSATCSIEVIDKVVLTGITVSGYTTSVPYKNTYQIGSYTCTASYSDGTSKQVTPTLTGSINTSILGIQNLTFSYTEDNITKSFAAPVKVTNVGAQGNVGTATQQPASTQYDFSSVIWESPNGNWTGTKNGSQVEARGIAITSNQSGVVVTSSSNYEKITSIEIGYASSNSGKGSISISVGTTNVGTQSVSTKTSSTSKVFNVSPTRNGTVSFAVTCTAGTIYIPFIKVSYSVGQTYPASPEDQAIAYATYFRSITGPYCQATDGGAMQGDVWNDLKTEYNEMVNDAKDMFCSGSSNETVIDARARYRILVTAYSNLENFIVDSNKTPLVNRLYYPSIINISNNCWIIVVIILVSFISFSSFLILRKKRD